MTLGRFERRILAAIVAVAGVTLIGALWFGQEAVAEAYRVGVNERVLGHLEDSLAVYRTHFSALRDDAERTADAVAFDQRAHAALIAEDRVALDLYAEGVLARYPNVGRVTFTSESGEVLATVEDAARTDETRYRALTLLRESASGADVEVTLCADLEPFLAHQRAGELIDDYAILVGGATYVSGFYTGVYIAFLLSVIVIALAVGIVVSRRVTRRVAVLAEAAERVGRGDLSVEVPSDGKDEIDDLTRAFNDMVRDIRAGRDRIEYLQRVGAWQEFAKRLAHEIKNPLTPIQLAVQQVHRTYDGEDARYRATLDDASAIVEEEITTLRRLVTEFSEFARLPVAALDDADLGEFVREALRGVDPASLVADTSLDEPPELIIEVGKLRAPVRIDPQMLRRALDNLVRNAVQAVATSAPEAGGWVRVATSVEDDEACLTVSDNGPGVPESERARVFEPYVTSKAEGTGLGLAIVKKVVLEHEGTIDCGEAMGGGARFTIRLPLAHADR